MDDKIKKTRKPRSEEAKRAASEKMKARAALLREQNGGKAVTAQTAKKMSDSQTGRVREPLNAEQKAAALAIRRDNSKAKNFIVVILGFLLELNRADKNEELFTAFVAAYPEMLIRRSAVAEGGPILLNQSVRKLRDEHGVVAERIWKKLFKCIQQGGYSMKENKAYDSCWTLNEAALDDVLMRRMVIQRKTGKPFSVSQLLEVLEDHEEFKRVSTEHKIELQTSRGRTKEVVVGRAKSKKFTTAEERAEIKERRNELKSTLKETTSSAAMFSSREELLEFLNSEAKAELSA